MMRHFTMDEFKCPCCGDVNMDPQFLTMLDRARGNAGTPFYINSGFRCPKHNAEVGGKPDSAHLFGLAADIRCKGSRARFKILDGLLMAGFDRIGIANTFIHADNHKGKHPMVCWLYGDKT